MKLQYEVAISTTQPIKDELATIEASIRNKVKMLYSVAEDFKQIIDRQLYKPQCATFDEYANKFGWSEAMVDSMLKVGKLRELLKAHNIHEHIFIIGVEEAALFFDLDEQEQIELAKAVLAELGDGRLTVELVKRCKRQLYPAKA